EMAYVNLARVPDQLADAVTPFRLKERLEAAAAVEPAEWLLPRIRSRVGERPVDLLSYAQGFLFLNHLTWSPRPVLQSYSASSPNLARVNAEHFRSERAPDFVVLALAPVDGRLPALEDGPALLAILRRYHPVLVERGLVLVERNREPTAETAPKPVLERR